MSYIILYTFSKQKKTQILVIIQQQINIIMQNYQTQEIVFSLIEILYERIDSSIAINRLLPLIPHFSTNILINLLQEIRLSNQIQYQTSSVPLEEEAVICITRIQKDSLMPKQLSQEKLRIQSPKKQSPKQSRSSARKILGLKKKESISIVNRLQSISFSDNKTLKNEARQNIKGKPFIALKNQQQEQLQQPETFHLRQRTQNRLNQLQKQKHWKKQKEEKFKEKLQEYKTLVEESNNVNVTYDYQGDAVKSKIKQEKLQLKMMKTGVGFASKKLKEGYNIITDSEHCDIQIQKNRIRSKEETYSGIKASNIPVFPMKFIEGQDLKNLKLEQYRKFYDFKYSRTGFGSRQVQMNKTTVDYQQDEINQRKIIKQTQKIEILKKTMRTLQNQRKIALPKLHGKYKVLDRYEQP